MRPGVREIGIRIAGFLPLHVRNSVAQRVSRVIFLLVSLVHSSFGRTMLAHVYLQGEGLELGGLNAPLDVPQSVRVRYVDRMTVPELRRQYPELGDAHLVEVDIVDDGETLATIAGGSQDFVIANHFLEHCQNPILAIQNMLRVIRPGGIVFLAVPDKRCTFDVRRPVTTFDHILTDYRNGPAWSRESHFGEFARLVGETPADEAESYARTLLEQDYSIHYHVWTEQALTEMLTRLRSELNFRFDVLALVSHGIENVCVLRKTAP